MQSYRVTSSRRMEKLCPNEQRYIKSIRNSRRQFIHDLMNPITIEHFDK